ncbi:MAG: AAA family ATPase, partial [Campylobacterota bacterium]|nr:AAA family ATPase [Campylobacterota bacterium]
MNLKLNNIGIIKEADIKLDGLTVIAGENDSGKSTVSKT